MRNGHRAHRAKQEDQLDEALEDSFPGSDPVAATQPHARGGAPHQHAQTAEQSIKDTANVIRNRAGEKISRDWVWLGGAFLLGCAVGAVAGAAPSAFARPSIGARMRRRLSDGVSDLRLRRKLKKLLDRLD